MGDFEKGSKVTIVGGKEPERTRAPLPYVEPHPFDGEVTEYFEGTEQVRVQGKYVNGLREGSWKEYWPNGQLKQDYSWSEGLKHGPELDWTEDGTLVCEGQNDRHLRTGTWTWWYPSGEHKQTCHYDDEGNKHGEYVWNQEDGSPRARHAFWHGERDGMWEWHDEPKHERMIRGHRVWGEVEHSCACALATARRRRGVV